MVKKLIKNKFELMSRLIWLGLVLIIFTLNACSSSKNSGENNTRYKKAEELKRTVKNSDLEEKNYINENNIKSIEKVSFDYNDDGKVIGSEKLSKVEYGKNGLADKTIIL